MSRPGTAATTSSTNGDSTTATEKTDQVPSNGAVKVAESKPAGPNAGPSEEPISSLNRILILVTVFLGMLLVSIDRTIVSTVRANIIHLTPSLNVVML